MRNRLAEIRNKKGLTLKELGKKIGMRDNTLSQYETGKRKPSEKALIQISNLFKIPISYLVGNGWSQNDVTWLLIYVYVNKFNDNFELPSGIWSTCGKIGKYGIEKESFVDFYDEDIPGFIKKAEEYLIEYKNNKITHNLILDYYDGDEDVVVDDGEIKEYVNENIDSLVKRYLSDNDLSVIRSEALDELKDDDIDLPSVLEKIISKELLKQLNLIRFEAEGTQESNGLNIDYLKMHVSESLFKQVENEITNKIKALNDYVFLSNIGEDFSSTGISPEYEIAKKISDDLKLKDFKNRQEYFEHDPYKASEETISNLSISSSDKSSLVDIVTYLLNENEKLKERIDELSEQINNTNDFTETSNGDYRGNR